MTASSSTQRAANARSPHGGRCRTGDVSADGQGLRHSHWPSDQEFNNNPARITRSGEPRMDVVSRALRGFLEQALTRYERNWANRTIRYRARHPAPNHESGTRGTIGLARIWR
jgi:hypothetical protein